MKIIFIIAYSVWAVYSGYKVLSGRSEWLDANKTMNKIAKFLLSAIIGYFVASFYLAYLVVNFVLILIRSL